MLSDVYNVDKPTYLKFNRIWKFIIDKGIFDFRRRAFVGFNFNQVFYEASSIMFSVNFII